jgi:hypothetical protein
MTVDEEVNEEMIILFNGDMSLLSELKDENDYRRYWDISFHNCDLYDFKKNYNWENGNYEDHEAKVKEYNIVNFNSLLEKENKILHYEYKISEVISFKAIIKNKDYYVKLHIYDTLSPNRWYNRSGEDHLDTTEYTIIINATYSKNREIL